MKARSLVVALAVVCVFLAWKLVARPVQQAQNTLTIKGGPLVASEADIQLLRQDLRAQKQKLIAQNLPMTESEAVKFWAVYNRYTDELRQINDEKFRLIKQYSDMWGGHEQRRCTGLHSPMARSGCTGPRVAFKICDGRQQGTAGEEDGHIFSARPAHRHDDGPTVVLPASAGYFSGPIMGRARPRGACFSAARPPSRFRHRARPSRAWSSHGNGGDASSHV